MARSEGLHGEHHASLFPPGVNPPMVVDHQPERIAGSLAGGYHQADPPFDSSRYSVGVWDNDALASPLPQARDSLSVEPDEIEDSSNGLHGAQIGNPGWVAAQKHRWRARRGGQCPSELRTSVAPDAVKDSQTDRWLEVESRVVQWISTRAQRGEPVSARQVRDSFHKQHRAAGGTPQALQKVIHQALIQTGATVSNTHQGVKRKPAEHLPGGGRIELSAPGTARARAVEERVVKWIADRIGQGLPITGKKVRDSFHKQHRSAGGTPQQLAQAIRDAMIACGAKPPRRRVQTVISRMEHSIDHTGALLGSTAVQRAPTILPPEPLSQMSHQPGVPPGAELPTMSSVLVPVQPGWAGLHPRGFSPGVATSGFGGASAGLLADHPARDPTAGSAHWHGLLQGAHEGTRPVENQSISQMFLPTLGSADQFRPTGVRFSGPNVLRHETLPNTGLQHAQLSPPTGQAGLLPQYSGSHGMPMQALNQLQDELPGNLGLVGRRPIGAGQTQV